jgi:hypothetical protein
MSTGGLVAIIIVVVIVVAAIVVAAMAAARRRRLQQRFGPEYDRVVGERGSQLKAESELAGRERRIRSLDIRPLSDAARANYASSWRTIQEQFVDQPENSVVKAQALVTTVMKDRGYPVEGHDQMLADLSVQHASTLEQYRLAHTISQSAANGQASTEDLRQAMIKYRALFGDLLGGAAAPDGSAAAPDDGAAAPHGDAVAQDAHAATPDNGAAAPEGGVVTPVGGAADGDPADQPAEARETRGTRPAAEPSAMNPDPAEADQTSADSTAAGVPAGETGREAAPRTRR